MRLLKRSPTEAQIRVLRELRDTPRTVHELVNRLDLEDGMFATWTYDRIHNILRRLEDTEHVRRIGTRPSHWELTKLGRKAAE